MIALDFLMKLRNIRDSDVLIDKEKNARIMMLIAEELDKAIDKLANKE